MIIPGTISYTKCPLCGTVVKVVIKNDSQYHGTCPFCEKQIVELPSLLERGTK